MLEQVILVNEADQEIGFMEKMEAHEKAVLHRAFSVFILNDAGEVEKYPPFLFEVYDFFG